MLNTEILLTIKLQQQLFVDPKRIRLLQEIQQCGSINQAAKNIKVSYKSAWDHLSAMNRISPKPLLERNVGGKNGGGTELTPYAKRLLQLYDLLKKTQEKAFQILQDENVPLDSLLHATSQFSLQSSARNQFFGRIAHLDLQQSHCFVDIQIEGLPNLFRVSITEQSAVRLQLELGKEVMLMIKAPWLKVYSHQPAESDVNTFPVKVEQITEKGNVEELILSLVNTPSSKEKIEFCSVIPKQNPIHIDQKMWIKIAPDQVVLVTLK